MAKAQVPAEITLNTEFERNVFEHVKAGYQILFVNTTEEARAETEIRRVALAHKMEMYTWDIFEGFTGGVSDPKEGRKYIEPRKALDALLDDIGETSSPLQSSAIVVFRDLDDFLKEPTIYRRLRSMAEGNRLVNNEQKRLMVIISASMKVPDKLKQNVTTLEYKLPDEAAIERQIEFLRQSVANTKPDKAVLSEELKDSLIQNVRGMTTIEIENCLARCIVRHDGFTPDMLKDVKEEKASIVKKSEVLTYIPEDTIASMDEIGGFDNYISWLQRRKLAYTKEAREMHIDYPKGCILMGMPGTGKSMVAYATCKLLGLPGYVMDIGSLFGSLVGESEQRTRDVLRQIDAQQGCVLVIDEADKALGNAVTSQGDSGVTRRVFGTILTWLAENKGRTFTIMTLNRTAGLPPELLRAGRFDEMFFTDLPTAAERKIILDIHLRKRHVDPVALGFSDGDWKTILDKTESYVGSELEAIVVESRYLALESHGTGTPTFDNLLKAVQNVTPMAKRNGDDLNALREFCSNQGTPVTTSDKKKRKRADRNREIEVN